MLQLVTVGRSHTCTEKKIMRRLLLPCLLLLLVSTCVRAQTRQQILIDSLEQQLEALAEKNAVVGFGVAVVSKDGIVFEKGYGYADYAAKTPYTVNTVQNIASISKTFIGISLLQAEKEGILSMDDPINKYLPFEVIHPRFPDQPILLKHLANHTAGITDDKSYNASYSLLEPFTVEKGAIEKWEYQEMQMASKQRGMELEEFLRAFFLKRGALYHKKNFLKAAPGTVHEYSNVGAALAAFVLESASGIPFPEWTKTRIFQPLGMTNTGWSMEEIDASTFFTHHFMNKQPMPNYTLATYPDGGVLTSVHQLSLYLSAAMKGRQDGNQILSASDYNRLIENSVSVDEDETYGYFWERTDDKYWGHTGGDPGVVTIMRANEASGYGFVMFFNGYAQNNSFYFQVGAALDGIGEKLAKKQ